MTLLSFFWIVVLFVVSIELPSLFSLFMVYFFGRPCIISFSFQWEFRYGMLIFCIPLKHFLPINGLLSSEVPYRLEYLPLSLCFYRWQGLYSFVSQWHPFPHLESVSNYRRRIFLTLWRNLTSPYSPDSYFEIMWSCWSISWVICYIHSLMLIRNIRD